jgi:uncharacterized protein (DUF3084 family)
MATLHNEMADLRIHYDEVVTDAKELGEKLAALIEHARKDQEEAQKVKSERDELSLASEQLQADLDSVYRERERALRERDEACQEFNIAQREKITMEYQIKETTRVASQVAEENRQLKSEVRSLRATVAQGHQQDLAWAEELEGKYLWLSVVEHFLEMCFLSPMMIKTEEQACRGGGEAFVSMGGPKDRAARALQASCHHRAIM